MQEINKLANFLEANKIPYETVNHGLFKTPQLFIPSYDKAVLDVVEFPINPLFRLCKLDGTLEAYDIKSEEIGKFHNAEEALLFIKGKLNEKN